MTLGSMVIVAGASLIETVTKESVLLLKQMVPLLLQGVVGLSLLLHDIENKRHVKRMAREIKVVLIGNCFVRTKIVFLMN